MREQAKTTNTARACGPIFTPTQGPEYESVHGKQGGHYNTFGVREGHGLPFLRSMFPDAQACELNLVLFSTSGVHGCYRTIEECDLGQDVTFLVVQPRVVTTWHGNATIETEADRAFLKALRQSSWEAVRRIGADTAPGKEEP